MKIKARVVLYLILFMTLFSCKKRDKCMDTSPPVTEEIVMQNTAFVPAEKTISKGTTVRWINKDPYAHTVTSSENKFDSGNLIEGQTYTFTFQTAGTYNYYCKYHLPGMTGKIIVN